ncbi:hypothetical protein TNCV_4052081 [Trichonephila clavipes]|nr:hypothetical protein TNCV_4052081 [Trichonephila clavipes]
MSEATENIEAEHTYLNIQTRGNLSSLVWIDSPLKYVTQSRDSLLCHVYYAPLNFKDVMLATGKLSQMLAGSSTNYLFRWDTVYVETPLHPEKPTVWCALWAGGIIGPYFIKNDEGHNVTVNGDRYRAMITNFFIPELNNHDV